MRNFESWLLSYLLNSFWQVPLVCAAAWLAARAALPLGAAAEHRIWVTALLSESLLPACSLSSWNWLRGIYITSSRPDRDSVSVSMGAGVAFGAVHPSELLLSGAALLYGSALLYFTVKFLWRCKAIQVLRRDSVSVQLAGDAAVCWAQYSKRYGIAPASLAASPDVLGPATIGVARKLVLLPASMAAGLPEADFRAVAAHELSHIRRNDFTKNLLYELLAVPVSYHPLLLLTRQRVSESREMICDEMAAALHGRNEYANSLLRLASLLVSGAPTKTAHAIGIFDAHTFERRLMRLSEKQNRAGGVRRAIVAAACLLCGVSTCGSALALHMQVDAGPANGTDSTPKPSGPIKVSSGVMAGNVLSKVEPKYPESAKKAKIQGSVVLDAIIGTDGTVEHLQVASGPPELNASALGAVRQWTYKPFLLNGSPVEVKTTVTITYSLAK